MLVVVAEFLVGAAIAVGSVLTKAPLVLIEESAPHPLVLWADTFATTS